MSERRRLVLFAALIAPLVLAALALIVLGGEERGVPGASAPDRARGGEEALPAAEAELYERIRRHERQEHRRDAKRLDSSGEPGPTQAVVRDYQAVGREAEPVARKFFGAYAAYEVGELTPTVEEVLRETTTMAFGRLLLEAPPRLPAGGGPPRAALLRPLDFYPGESGSSDLRAGELVGATARGGEVSEIAIEVALVDGRWLVRGVGR